MRCECDSIEQKKRYVNVIKVAFMYKCNYIVPQISWREKNGIIKYLPHPHGDGGQHKAVQHILFTYINSLSPECCSMIFINTNGFNTKCVCGAS